MAIETLVQQEKHNVQTTLDYWDDPGNGVAPPPIVIGKGKIVNERPHISHTFEISDVNGEEEHYTLDSHGFQYHHFPCKETEFVDDKKIQEEYYPECKELLKEVTGANRIYIFNHKVRRGPTKWHHLNGSIAANRGPVTKAHVDQSYEGAEKRLRWELPDEVDELVKKRYQIINVWRPIKTITKDPVAVADASTVPDEDLVAAGIVDNGFPGEQWVVKHNPKHKWYFKHRLGTEEVLLIKCFDSEKEVARRALHCSFEDPVYRDEESRQSIEVRCLVLYGE